MAMSFGLNGKVLAVTGGASGIGYATTKLLLSEGANVSVSDISESNLTQAAKDFADLNLPGRLVTTVVDVRKPEEVNSWVAKTCETFGKLDGAINLAGVLSKAFNIETVAELNDDDWHFTFDVNIHGVMYCMRAELQNMNDGGSIVNASSIAGIIGFPKHAAYTAAKHAVNGLTKSAAKDVGDRGIRVNAIAPGPIDTPMNRAGVEKGGGAAAATGNWQIKREGRPEEAAALIAWLLSPLSTYITGTVQAIDGGWTC